MKKVMMCLAAALSCLLIFSGCASDTPPSNSSDQGSAPNTSGNSSGQDDTSEISSKRDNIPFADGQQYAVAYLGYQEIEDLDYYAEQYLDGDQLPVHYVSDGDFYLVIPRYDGMSLSLLVNDIETSEGLLRFEDPDCEPFIVQCNASDIFADVTVRLSYEGETVEFSPFISLENGSVQVGESGLDISAS